MSLNKKAFSLVELSIVLIIIGLLVGGVASGSKLIKQSKLRAQVTQINDLVQAKNTFILTYDALPGDMDNAKDFFPSCTDATSNDCNGNGDKIVTNDSSSDPGGENVRFPEHLMHAGIIGGSYTGSKATGNVYELGTSLIPAKLSGGGLSYRSHSAYGGTYNGFQLGLVNGVSMVLKSIVSPQDAYNIDKKYDDGLANSGDIITQDGSGDTGCITSNAYVLTTSTVSCRMWFDWQKEPI